MKKHIICICIALSFVAISTAQSVDDYFKLAAENNPSLQAKYKNFEAALQRVAQVSSLSDPTLTLGYFISPVETRVGPQRARFSLSQMFPWFGTLSAREDASTLLAEAKYQEFLNARNQLYYQVSAAYYPLLELKEFIAIEQENLTILNTYKDIATAKFEHDQGAMVNVLRVDIMRNDAITNLAILEKKEKPLETRLNALLNRSVDEPIEVNNYLLSDTVISVYSQDSILDSNPLLHELDLKIQASKANEQVIVLEGLPKLGVGLDYVIVDPQSEMTVPDNGKDVFMPMVSVSLPIYRGKYKAAKKEAQLLQESFSLQRQEISNRLISSYEMVWFELQKQLSLIQLYDEQILETEESLTLIFSAFSNSGNDFEEVLRMQQQLLLYQKMKATAWSEFRMSLAEMDYITAKSNY